jgi:hypothetical protein
MSRCGEVVLPLQHLQQTILGAYRLVETAQIGVTALVVELKCTVVKL